MPCKMFLYIINGRGKPFIDPILLEVVSIVSVFLLHAVETRN